MEAAEVEKRCQGILLFQRCLPGSFEKKPDLKVKLKWYDTMMDKHVTSLKQSMS